jgi:hypothetical protein
MYVVFIHSVRRLLVTSSVVPSSPILVTPMKEARRSSETSVLKEPHGVTSQKTPFFITILFLAMNPERAGERLPLVNQFYIATKAVYLDFSKQCSNNMDLWNATLGCGFHFKHRNARTPSV